MKQLLSILLTTLLSTVGIAAEAPPKSASAPARFSSSQLEQLVAPIALYPDSLTIQILVAATYPLEIVEADRWRSKNPAPKGAELDKALEAQSWDPSVESLTHFPDLLKRMADNLDWTKDLGDAFLEQKDDVLDTVQRMRVKAMEAGTLKSTEQQVVTKEVVKEKTIIKIEPAKPEVVYVPTYAPSAVYGPTYSTPTPYYPPMNTYPPGYVPTTNLLSFGVGMAVGAAVWGGGCDWDDHHVYNNYYGGGGGGGGHNNVNVNVDNSKNVTKVGGGERTTWQHNPEHRGGVRYGDPSTAKKYQSSDRRASPRAEQRDVARGYDRRQAATPGRQGAQPGTRPSTGPARPERANAASRPTGGEAPPTKGGRENALGGYQNGKAARDASNRGAASRNTKSYAQAAPAQAPESRPAGDGGRGGGGSQRGGGGGSLRGGGGGGSPRGGGGGRQGGGNRGGRR